MNTEHEDILKHTLGMNYNPTRDRNYYADEPDSIILNEMVDKGLMERGRTIPKEMGGLQFFSATENGKKAVGYENI